MEYIWVILTISWLMFVRCEDFKDILPQDLRDRELSLVTYDGPSKLGGSDTGSGAGAFVIDTNLSSRVADYLLWKLQRIYRHYKTTKKRAAKFKKFLKNAFPYSTITVIIKSSAAQYFQKWYFMAFIQGDRVLAFGR